MRALGKGSIASAVKAVLDVARWGLWLAALLLTLAALAYIGLLALTAAGSVNPALLQDLQAHIHLRPNVEYRGPPEVSWPVILWAFAVGGVAIGGGIVIVGRLRRLFEGFSSGEPFRKEYAGHLRVIWIAMLTIELSRIALSALLAVMLRLLDHSNGTVSFGISLDLTTWLSIFVLIVLAEVFREGARMKEEQELTV